MAAIPDGFQRVGDAPTAGLLIVDAHNQYANMSFGVGVDPTGRTLYLEHFAALDEFTRRGPFMKPGYLYAGEELIGDHQYGSYVDWASPCKNRHLETGGIGDAGAGARSQSAEDERSSRCATGLSLNIDPLAGGAEHIVGPDGPPRSVV